MIIEDNKKATPLDATVEYPLYYRVNDLIIATPNSEGGGLSTFSFEGKHGETYVVSIKVRQELDPLYRQKIWLSEEYVERERSMADIADQFGITPAAINQWLVKNDIPTRERGRK